MSLNVARRVLSILCILVISGPLRAADSASRPPKPWPANPFTPLTAERIAALPPTERTAWQAYWAASGALAAKLPTRAKADVSSLTPIATVPKGGIHTKGLRLDAPAEWYRSPEAQLIADRVVAWQSGAGAWKKGIDYNRPHDGGAPGGGLWISGTFDNNATIFELRYLARVISATPDPTRSAAWRTAFDRGVAYVLAAQFPNGGFPQVYPLAGGYHDAVTFNDDAATHAFELLRDVSAAQGDYAFVSPELQSTAAERLARSVRCVLATQLRNRDGRLTVWCQQYDALTLQPCAARNFEPIADCAQESAGLVLFLMSLPKPTPDIVAAVDGAVAWFRLTARPGFKWVRVPAELRGELVPAPGALYWARFYEPGTTTPIFGDRDRTIHYDLAEISPERRAGYSWYGDWPAAVLARYDSWRAATR